MIEYIELPGVYIDDVVGDDDTARPALINRIPEPDENHVPADQEIWLDIVDIGAAGIDVSATIVYVEGVQAYNAGSFVAPYTGATWALTSPGAGSPDGLRIKIIPPAPWTSLDTITIRVVSDLVGGGFPLDASYDFTIEDLTPPEVVSASAIGAETIRVIFDEPIRLLGDGNSIDGLNPDNYTFEAIHDSVTPAVPISAVFVEEVSSIEVEIILDWEMTPGVSYRLTVSDVADVYDNPIGAEETTFDSYQPQVPEGRAFELYEMMAAIDRQDDTTQDLLRFLNCMQEATNRLLVDIDQWVDIFDIDRASESFVDAMLADLGNPFRFDLTLNQKRKLARILVAIYQLKGTDPGIINTLRFFLGIESEILTYTNGFGWVLGESELGVDTFLGLDEPRILYSFDVSVDRALSDEERRQVRELVDYMKPAHTHHMRTIEP